MDWGLGVLGCGGRLCNGATRGASRAQEVLPHGGDLGKATCAGTTAPHRVQNTVIGKCFLGLDLKASGVRISG